MLFEKSSQPLPAINITALLDIAFILVIFIILSANFHKIRNIDIKLPHAKASQSIKPKSLSVHMLPGGSIIIQGKTYSLQRLTNELQNRKIKYDTVLIFADKSVTIEPVVQIISTAKQIGYQSVGIATSLLH